MKGNFFLEHRNHRIAIILIIATIVLSAISAVGLWYMHGLHEKKIDKEKPKTLQWDIPMTEDNVCNLPMINVKRRNYVITRGIVIENGCATPIDVEKYHQLFERKMLETERIHSEKQHFQGIDEMTVSLSEKESQRVTAIFDRASAIYITNLVSFQKGILINSYDMINNTVKYMKWELLKQNDISYTNYYSVDAVGMNTSGQYQYSAILFIPKELTWHEFYTDDHGQKNIQTTATYPIIDSSGYASGAFFLVEANAIEDLPD